jgi:hypothetical protein
MPKLLSVTSDQAKRLESNLHAAAQGKAPKRGRLVEAAPPPARVPRGPEVQTVADLLCFLDEVLARKGGTR